MIDFPRAALSLYLSFNIVMFIRMLFAGCGERKS